MNTAAEFATRLSRSNFIGTSFSRFFFNLDGRKNPREAILQGTSPVDRRCLKQARDGTVIQPRCNASLSRDADGALSGIAETARNIGQERQPASEMKDELRHLYEILETLPVYVCLLTPDYRMPYANRYFRENFGEPRDLRCFELLFNRTSVCEDCQTFSVIQTRAPRNWHWTGPNGRNYDIYDLPFSNPDGSVSVLEMGIDITDRNLAVTALRQARTELEERVTERTEELEQRNAELREANLELIAIKRELQKNLEELRKREQDLSRALSEKEILLSEMHHRVKNNLTAFISLMNMEGDNEGTPAGAMFRQDLQNRARSMALIHETLYHTHLFNEVDMGVYLTNLLDQVAGSFMPPRQIRTSVDASNVLLDIPRATPAGLIVNELVPNSFKYAFPESFDTASVRGAPPVIRISLTKRDRWYEMAVSDNGIGLPAGIDIHSTRSLGLKLVMFLARHQLRAKINISTKEGTTFTFKFLEETR